MKVDEPRFNSSVPFGTVTCTECPFADEAGNAEPHTPLHELCDGWARDHITLCPTPETYAEACRLAEEAEKEGSK